MGLQGFTGILLLLTILVMVVAAVTLSRFRRLLATNEKVERNQRVSIELMQRQVAALERIATVMGDKSG